LCSKRRAIGGSAICGLIWEFFGPEYVFMIAGVLSIMNFIAAIGIKPQIPAGFADIS
jgi:hypothetical protein